MIDRDPVETRAKITLGPRQQIPGGRAQILQFGGVFGRNDEAKVVAVVPAALGETVDIAGRIRAEGAGRTPLASRAVALQISQVIAQ